MTQGTSLHRLSARRHAHLLLAASLACLAAAAGVMRRFPPDAGTFYPACPFFQTTGLLCPGCGATHALADLFAGHLHQALRHNALFVLLLPCAVLYGLAAYRRAVTGLAPACPPLSRLVWVTLVLASLVFAVARNIG